MRDFWGIAIADSSNADIRIALSSIRREPEKPKQEKREK